MNKQLLLDAIDFIERNPQHWDQSKWHCGTTHCLAGVIELLTLNDETVWQRDFPKSALSISGEPVFSYSQKALGISDYEANELFSSFNTLEEIKELAERLF